MIISLITALSLPLDHKLNMESHIKKLTEDKTNLESDICITRREVIEILLLLIQVPKYYLFSLIVGDEEGRAWEWEAGDVGPREYQEEPRVWDTNPWRLFRGPAGRVSQKPEQFRFPPDGVSASRRTTEESNGGKDQFNTANDDY